MSIITPEEAHEAYLKYGSQNKASKKLNVSRTTFKKYLDRFYNDPNEAILHRNCVDTRTPIDDVQYYWVKTGEVSMMVKRQNAMSYEEIRDELIQKISSYAPVYSPIVRNEKGDNLLIVDPADIHIGKYSAVDETSYNYNRKVAKERVIKGINDLLVKAEPFGISKIVFVIGNDVLHIDQPHRKTTSGTPQDTDGQWWEMFLDAKELYIKSIEQMTQIADVHVVFCPSNHDYVSGWMLADTIYSWFRNNPNVTFGDDQKNITTNHRKYIEFGNNLIGFTHGDGAKEKDLANLMQYEAREVWGRTKHAYFYTHHIHHKDRKSYGLTDAKLEKDNIGVTTIHTGYNISNDKNVYVETVRSPSPADGWHHRNGYVNQQAVEAFIHCPQNGQIARLTQFF